MIVLAKEQIITMHSMLISETGGIDGLRDVSLLESAIKAPFQSFEGTEVYPTIYQKASRLGFGIIKNHPFIDGNKRIGAHTMLVFLSLNGIEIESTQKSLYEIILGVADDRVSFEEFTDWIIEHSL